jgi:hypothetical protein
MVPFQNPVRPAPDPPRQRSLPGYKHAATRQQARKTARFDGLPRHQNFRRAEIRRRVNGRGAAGRLAMRSKFAECLLVRDASHSILHSIERAAGETADPVAVAGHVIVLELAVSGRFGTPHIGHAAALARHRKPVTHR